VAANPELRQGRKYLVCYLGVMGPNDGLDLLLTMAHHVVHTRKMTDVTFVLMGAGDCFDELRGMASELKLDHYVTFTGRIPDEQVLACLSTADVGIAPDPKDLLNDVSTMNKIIEYMAVGVPVLAFDLVEAQVSAGAAGEYARDDDPRDMGDRLIALLHDPVRRARMGLAGRDRFHAELAWEHQAPKLLEAYRRLLEHTMLTSTSAK
jgi:glycosyltransferase involved in cell wall biosynthesis